jgi:hypothetical protein
MFGVTALSRIWRNRYGNVQMVSKDYGFTRFLRNLEPGRPLDRESREFDEVWAALRRLLVNELKRRSLWSLSPACLGIYGCASWSVPEAVEELVADCFVYIFAERFRSLKAQLRSKLDIEGLVLRNVRNFLQETQRRQDPVGFRVFTVLRSAVRNALSAGALQVVAGSPGVQRDTVLAFRTATSEEEAARPADLRPHVLAWNDDLLPDLITARGWDVRQVTARLERHLHRLEAAGVRAFRFHDLVDALRQDARARWRAVWVCSPDGIPPQPEEDGLAAVTRLVEPLFAWDERESVHKLLACLERSVERVPEPPARSRDYLRRLLAFLKSHATDSPDEVGEEKLPSHRQLANLLDIPRERLPGLFQTLLDLAEACRRKLSGEGSP